MAQDASVILGLTSIGMTGISLILGTINSVFIAAGDGPRAGVRGLAWTGVGFGYAAGAAATLGIIVGLAGFADSSDQGIAYSIIGIFGASTLAGGLLVWGFNQWGLTRSKPSGEGVSRLVLAPTMIATRAGRAPGLAASFAW